MRQASKYNEWVNSKGIRTFMYDNPHTRQNKSVSVQQCRGDYTGDTHQVTLNYILDDWIDEYHAPCQLRKWLYNKAGVKTSICTVENLKASRKNDKKASRIQFVWLSAKEPSNELMLDLEKRIIELSQTARVKKCDLDIYQKKVYGDAYEDEGDKKEYVMNTQEIINAIENGLM